VYLCKYDDLYDLYVVALYLSVWIYFALAMLLPEELGILSRLMGCGHV
jgi:hypothetical protein